MPGTIGRHAELLLPGSGLSHLDGYDQPICAGREADTAIPGLAHRVDPTSAHLTLQDLRREPTIYLLPEWETEKEALKYLAEVSNEIFEEQLNGWYRVPSVWPDNRELNALLRWFDCSFHSMVFDVSDERLEHTEM